MRKVKNLLLLSFLFLGPTALSWAEIPAVISGNEVIQDKVEKVELNNPKFKATVVVFVSARCPCSASHETSLSNLKTEFPDFQFVGIHSNQDEDRETTKAHFLESRLPFPIIEDPQAKLANLFSALKTPHAFILSSSGEILFQGGIDDSRNSSHAKEFYLKTALQEIREGKKPTHGFVRTLGCAIRRSS